ncbi:MAG: hypothetical protein AB7V58_04455 [Solirubrobacterales bacterium]
MRLALLLTIAALLAGLPAGCGGSSSTSSSSGGGEGATAPAPSPSAPPGSASHACGDRRLRVGAVPCEEAKAVLAAWRSAPACRIQGGASHASCKVRGYLCIAARQGKRAAVSCARPGHSILFAPPKPK